MPDDNYMLSLMAAKGVSTLLRKVVRENSLFFYFSLKN